MQDFSIDSLDQVVEPLRSNPEILGVLLVGSTSRFYGDALSDVDLEVIVSDAYYDGLDVSQILSTREWGFGNVETFFISKGDFLAKKNSTSDPEHWTYEECVILHDREGLLASELPKIRAISPPTAAARVRLHYFEFLFEIRRMSKLLSRGNELNTRLAAGHAALSLLKFVSIASNRWPPVPHWGSQMLDQIEGLPTALKELVVQLLREPRVAIAERLIEVTDDFLLQLGHDFVLTKTALTCVVLGPEHRRVREGYSLL